MSSWTSMDKMLNNEAEPIENNNIKEGKKEQKSSRFSKFAHLALGAIAIVGVAYIALDINGLTGNSFKETVDKTAYHFTQKTVFADLPTMREHLLNMEIQRHPKYGRFNPLGSEMGDEATHRVRIIAQEKLNGTFEDPIKFNKIYSELEQNILEEKNNTNHLVVFGKEDIRTKAVTNQKIKNMRIDYASDAYQGKLTYK